MNHARNALRFSIVIGWLVYAGILFTAFSNIGNARALGWSTWLFYIAVFIVTTYVGFFATKKLWSIL